MSKVDPKTVYCLCHGWVEVAQEAEIIPGFFVPVCHLCAED